MPNQKLAMKVIPQAAAEGRSVLIMTDDTPRGVVFFQGDGRFDFCCGGCGAVLMRAQNIGQVSNAVLVCAECKSYNDTGSGPNFTGGNV